MRISDWSSDVCSSDLPAERALTRFRRGGETAAQRAGDSTRRAANRRRWRDERIAAQRAARGLWPEAQRGEADQAGEDHVISGHELDARPDDQPAADSSEWSRVGKECVLTSRSRRARDTQ